MFLFEYGPVCIIYRYKNPLDGPESYIQNGSKSEPAHDGKYLKFKVLIGDRMSHHDYCNIYYIFATFILLLNILCIVLDTLMDRPKR